MVEKTTVTMYPPDYGAEPHKPIEVHPDRVKEMQDKDWRTEKEMGIKPPEPETPRQRYTKKTKTKKSASADSPSAEDPPTA